MSKWITIDDRWRFTIDRVTDSLAVSWEGVLQNLQSRQATFWCVRRRNGKLDVITRVPEYVQKAIMETITEAIIEEVRNQSENS